MSKKSSSLKIVNAFSVEECMTAEHTLPGLPRFPMCRLKKTNYAEYRSVEQITEAEHFLNKPGQYSYHDVSVLDIVLLKLDSRGTGSSPRTDPSELRTSILKKAFDVYDTNQSGTIDHEELRKLFEDLGWPAHDQCLERAIRVLDDDVSGGIDFSEFLKWTEFAYASRVLYRAEMMPTTPRRRTAVNSFHESYDEEDGSPVFLRTVHEHKETGCGFREENEDVVQREAGREPNGTTGTNGEAVGRAGRWSCNILPKDELRMKGMPACDPQSNRKDESLCGILSSTQSSCQLPGVEACGIRGRQRRYAARVSFQGDQVNEVESRDISCIEEECGLDKTAEVSSSRDEDRQDCAQADAGNLVRKVHEEALTGGPETCLNVDRSVDCRSEEKDGKGFGMPIKKMATMLLGTPKLGQLLTSRVRSHSMVNLGHGKLGARTESKMTVRMRWACGQFQGSSEGEQDNGGSEVEPEEDVKKRPKWPDRVKEATRSAEGGRQEAREAKVAGRMRQSHSQAGLVGLESEDLRRVRSE